MEKNQTELLRAALQKVLMEAGVVAKDVGAVSAPQLLLAADEYVDHNKAFGTVNEQFKRLFGSPKKKQKQSGRMIEIEFDRLEGLEGIAIVAHEKIVRMVYDKNNMKVTDGIRSHAQIDEDLAKAVAEWWKTIPK